MAKTNEAIRIIQAAQAETLDVFGASLTVLNDAANLPLLSGVQIVPPGYGVPPHVHEHDDEVFVMLDGEVTVVGPRGEARIAAGDSVELPKGIPHSFRNDSDSPARVLVMALPGRQALEMFRHFDRAGKAPQPLAPADIPAIAGQYGVRFV